MNHEDGCFCELAPLYTLDLLNSQERQWVEQQVATSPELAAELAELQATVGAIAYAAPPLPVAADLKDRLFQRLSQPISVEQLGKRRFAAMSPQHGRSVEWQPWFNRARVRPTWARTGGAIAALALLALGVENERLRQTAKNSSTLIETLQQADAIVYTLRGTEKATIASGRLVVSPSQKAIAIVVRDLPQLPPHQVYRLWAMPTGGTKPSYCGQFRDTNSSASTRWTTPDVACSTSPVQMLITAELVADPPVPAGTLVMKSVL